MIFLPVQCRMARAALGWGVRELAAAAKVAIDTVVRFERGDDLKDRTVEAIQRALEAGGIEFIDENGGGPGVRVRKRQSRKKSQ
jgi:transcriptional regulator with XRE-family HTH domain